MRKFELFKMEENESICEMYTRLNNICNSINQLGKPYPMEDRSRKVLRSLTKIWELKVTTIEEAKDRSNW